MCIQCDYRKFPGTFGVEKGTEVEKNKTKAILEASPLTNKN